MRKKKNVHKEKCSFFWLGLTPREKAENKQGYQLLENVDQ